MVAFFIEEHSKLDYTLNGDLIISIKQHKA